MKRVGITLAAVLLMASAGSASAVVFRPPYVCQPATTVVIPTARACVPAIRFVR